LTKRLLTQNRDPSSRIDSWPVVVVVVAAAAAAALVAVAPTRLEI